MAQSKSVFEDLPVENLKDIMMRVATNPDSGAIDTYNTFFIKEFREFSDDEDVLKTVIFKDLSTYYNVKLSGPSLLPQKKSGFSELYRQFKAFHKIGGYIYKAAKLDNHSAQILLAKLIIRSTSEVYRGRNEAPIFDNPLKSVVNDKISKRVEASSFIAHFLPRSEIDNEVNNTTNNILMHYKLVKKFLQQASLKEVKEMEPYLTDYVTCFNNPKVETHCNKVLELLQELNSNHTIVDSETIIAQTYTKFLCRMIRRGCKVMHYLGVNIKVVEDMKKWLVKGTYLTPDELMNKFTTLESFLNDNMNNEDGDRALLMEKMTEIIFVLKGTLTIQLDAIKLITDKLALLVSEFDAIFPM